MVQLYFPTLHTHRVPNCSQASAHLKVVAIIQPRYIQASTHCVPTQASIVHTKWWQIFTCVNVKKFATIFVTAAVVSLNTVLRPCIHASSNPSSKLSTVPFPPRASVVDCKWVIYSKRRAYRSLLNATKIVYISRVSIKGQIILKLSAFLIKDTKIWFVLSLVFAGGWCEQHLE